MSNGTTTDVTPTTNGNGKLDNQVINNGVKLLGEALVPGASLLMEKHIGAGLTLGTLGVLGGAAFGSVFGPIGYVLARYGASAVSYSQSFPQPPAPATNGAATKILLDTNKALLDSNKALASSLAASTQAAPGAVSSSPVAPAFTPAAPSLADVIARLTAISDQQAEFKKKQDVLIQDVSDLKVPPKSARAQPSA